MQNIYLYSQHTCCNKVITIKMSGSLKMSLRRNVLSNCRHCLQIECLLLVTANVWRHQIRAVNKISRNLTIFGELLSGKLVCKVNHRWVVLLAFKTACQWLIFSKYCKNFAKFRRQLYPAASPALSTPDLRANITNISNTPTPANREVKYF